MMHRQLSGILVLVFVAAVAGCDGASPVSPTFTRSSPVMLDVTLSGMVFELTPSGRAPIEGVTLHCGACGAETHAWAYTNSEGLYEFIGVWPDGGGSPKTSISVGKDGFVDPPGLPTPDPGWRTVIVDGDTRFDIELVRQ
jgi:hypothetical protein